MEVRNFHGSSKLFINRHQFDYCIHYNHEIIREVPQISLSDAFKILQLDININMKYFLSHPDELESCLNRKVNWNHCDDREQELIKPNYYTKKLVVYLVMYQMMIFN